MRCMVEIERYVKNAFDVVWLERDYFTDSELTNPRVRYASKTLAD
jgi:hypothetical protein